MKKTLFACTCTFALCITGWAQPTPLYFEDFESGNLDGWTMGATPFSIQSGTNQVPEGGNYSAFYPSCAAFMNANLPSGLGITDEYDSYGFSVWIFDYATNTSLRAFTTIRAYSGGAYDPSGGWVQILAIGQYNTTQVGTYVGSKYAGRIVSGTPAGWFSLTSGPDRTEGWHHFSIERGTNGVGEVLVKFFVDDILGAVFTNTSTAFNLTPWDSITAGLGAGSTPGYAWFDGFKVIQGQPFIGDEPQRSTNLLGDTVNFTVGAYGPASPLSSWWFKDGTVLSDGGRISGSSSETLTLSGLQDSDSGWYSVIVSNAWGARSNAAPAYLQVSGVNISLNPTNLIVNLGSNDVAFYCEATGTGNLTYQWRKDGADILGANSSAYIIPTVGPDDIATDPGYVCFVSNDQGSSALSAIATLRSNAPPVLTEVPNLYISPGSPMAVSMTVTDDFSSLGLFQTFESTAVGGTATFQSPSYSGSTSPTYVSAAGAYSYVTNANIPVGNPIAGSNVLYVTMNFTNDLIPGWDRLTTSGFNPIVSFTGPLKFDIYTDRPMGVAASFRETNPTGDIGQNGGTTGTLEFVGVTQGGSIPITLNTTTAGTWTSYQFDVQDPTWAYNYVWPFTGDGYLDSTTGKGVLDGLALTPADGTGVYTLFIDNVQSVPLQGLTYSLDVAPPDATIDQYNGLIRWTVPAAEGVVYDFTVRVTDHLGLFATRSFTVTAATAGPAPEPLQFQVVDGNLVLSWTNSAFRLESATDVSGAFSEIQNATSPYTNSLGSGTEFFRLAWP